VFIYCNMVDWWSGPDRTEACWLCQRFLTCGPRTPGGPRGASKGSTGNPRKAADPLRFN